MDDESDFKKARGFLLTYSALVLALWYFGADLTQFKLMGNEIKLQHRTESAWLVLAIINIYFLARCYQRVPQLGFYFDEPMNDIYDSALVWSAVRWKRRALNKDLLNNFDRNHRSKGSIKMASPVGEATARETAKRLLEKDPNGATKLHRYSRASRTQLHLRRFYSHTSEDGVFEKSGGAGNYPYKPPALFTWPVKAFAIARGLFVTPWFTDHIAPLALGGISTVLALCNWYAINFCTGDHPYAAKLCGM